MTIVPTLPRGNAVRDVASRLPRLSFLTLQRGNAVRDALRHTAVFLCQVD
ncbi:DUF1534 domain-containing protein [Pseudomonas syringae]|nr:DUF1534 domain-containing protein [Pseudomonas syringae]PYD14090.1 hypothetical protein DND47_18030 [Pseudomonas syringae pv. syringae]MCF5311703.1 DUF1534 domain-containing protein [Pseudomonas syringae]MCF5361355.1 DUF1534 domain-containing protein [Pseudomonas syringae]MCF5397960.1 DUF1534 domain-containing protein [Pseudomonas syringae]